MALISPTEFLMGTGGPFQLSPGPTILAWAILKGPPALPPSPEWIWNVQCGHVSSPVSCFPSPGSLALVHGLQLIDSVPSTWLLLPCSDLVGWCPTPKVAICAGVILNSSSLGKQTITFFFPGFTFFLLRYYF